MPPADHRAWREVAPGTVVAGKFRIEEVIGHGGMGVVVAATHLKLEERVAIKFLLPHAVNDDAVRRFEREARAAVKIKSEHVARVIDVGTLDDGSPYIVMEHLEGADLGRIVKTRGPLPVELAIEHIAQACEALAEAHALGMVHRDLKPSNLFLTRRRDGSFSIKLLDFGISKLSSSDGVLAEATLTNEESFLGSPIYMSPEQMSDPKRIDARSDVWSLGATLYRLLSGSPPFQAESMPAMCAMIVNGTRPAPLSGIRPDVPPELDAIVDRCLQRSPSDRFANVADLASALADVGSGAAAQSANRARRILEAAGVAATVPVPIGTVDAPTPSPIARSQNWPRTYSTWASTHNGPKRSRSARSMLIASGAVAVLAFGVVLGAFATRRAGSVGESGPAAAVAPAPAAETQPSPSAAQAPAATAPAPEPTASAAAAPEASAAPTSEPAVKKASVRAHTPPPATKPARASAPAAPAAAPPPKAAQGDLFDER